MKEILKPGFTYTFEVLGKDGRVKDSETVHNIMPTPALNYLLNASLKGGTQYSTWYVSVYEANRTPLPADTLATLIADCEESTDYTVIGGARPTVVLPEVSDGAVSTIADPNILAFTVGATIRGSFVTTGSVRGGTTGLLLSAVLLSSPKPVEAGEYLRVSVGFALV